MPFPLLVPVAIGLTSLATGIAIGSQADDAIEIATGEKPSFTPGAGLPPIPFAPRSTDFFGNGLLTTVATVALVGAAGFVAVKVGRKVLK